MLSSCCCCPSCCCWWRPQSHQRNNGWNAIKWPRLIYDHFEATIFRAALNGWTAVRMDACLCLWLCVCVCVTCLFVLVRACVHFMGYLQAQLTASVFLLPYCRLLTFGLRSRSSSSNARPTMRLLNLAVQRDLRTDEQGANRIRKLPSALGIFFPSIRFHFDSSALCGCSCTLPDLLPLWGPKRLIHCHVHTPLFD